MKRTNLLLGFSAMIYFSILCSNFASAQQQMLAWVSRTGNDSGSCLSSGPCMTFARAISVVSPGATIRCADSGNFAAVEITKAVTIDCEGTNALIAHVLQSPGINVIAGATDKVIIRNLSIFGWTQLGNPVNSDGIKYSSGAELEVDNVKIMQVGPNSAGILVNKSTAGILSARNSSFSNVPVGIKMGASAPNIVASVTNTSFNNLTSTGIEVGANSYVGVHSSVFSAIYGYGINAATSTSTVYATDNTFTNNNVGISATVAGAKINASNNKLFGNSKAFNVASGATFLSGQANLIDINPGNPPTGALTYR